MKNLSRLLVLMMIVTAFALGPLAQTTPATATPATSTTATTTAAAPQVDEKAKTELYERWRVNRNQDAAKQKIAYEAAKEYLEKYGSEEDQYVVAIRKWIGKYESALLEFNYRQALEKKDYATAFKLGREILNANPDRLDVKVTLGWAGYLASTEKNEAFNNDAATYAREAIKAIESGGQPKGTDAQGKEVVSWAPFTNQEEALGGLYFGLGSFMMKNNQSADAANAFYKAAQLNGFTKKEANTYANLARAYEKSEYQKLATEYRTITAPEGGAEKPEAKAVLAKLEQVTDRIIDAYARAIALSTDPKSAGAKADWMKTLTALYKFRNNDSEAGLNELIAGVLAKPLPTSAVPADSPSATTMPATTTPAMTTGGTAMGNGAMKPATVTTTTQTKITTTATPAQPATNGDKPKP